MQVHSRVETQDFAPRRRKLLRLYWYHFAMLAINLVQSGPDLEATRALFAEYRDLLPGFISDTGICP